MNCKFKIFILLFVVSVNLIAQNSDSSIFRLKKINIGIEFGRSPYRLHQKGQNGNSTIRAKVLPYVNLSIGYNFFLKKHNYFIPRLGYDFEFSNYDSRYTVVESFNGVNTIGTQTVSFVGYKNSKFNELHIKNSSSVNIVAEYLRLFDMSKSDKIMFCASGAMSLNYRTFMYSKVDYNYAKDSLGTTVDSFNYSYVENRSNTKRNDLYAYFHLGVGFLVKGTKVNQQFSLKLATRLNDCNSDDAYIKRSLLRLIYNLNF